MAAAAVRAAADAAKATGRANMDVFQQETGLIFESFLNAQNMSKTE